MHASICDFILDCVQNSVEAGADLVKVDISQTAQNFSVRIEDNGCGMSGEEIERAKDPFYTDGKKHEKRKVGLGIPFLIQALEQADGRFMIDSEKGRGTGIGFDFRMMHVDTPPVGDIASLLLQSLLFDGNYELLFCRGLSVNGKEKGYSVRRSEILDILGDLNDADSMILARQYLRSQEDELIQGDV